MRIPKVKGSAARLTAVLTATTVAAGILVQAGAALSGSRWENHVNASLIWEIIYRDGELFMATNGGILIYNPSSGQFEQFHNTSGLPSSWLTSLRFDETGDLWVGTEDIGVLRVTLGADGLSARSFSPLFQADPHITSLDLWDGEIVYGTVNGAGMFEGGLPGPTFSKPKGLPDDMVYDVFADGDYVWFATAGGAAVLDRLGFITPVPGGPPVARVVEKTDDAVWVGSDSGVWRMALSDSSWTQTGPSAFRIHSLHWDGQTMWAGGTSAFFEYDSGAQEWLEYEMRQFYGPYGLGGSGVRGQVLGITRLPGGEVYFGATQEGKRHGCNLIRYDGQLENLRPNNVAENRLDRLSYDVDGSIWVSCKGLGVGKLTPSGFWVNYNTSIPEAGRLSSLYTNATLLADADGHKWFSTLTVDDDDHKPLDELDDKLDAVYANDEWTRRSLYSGGGDTYGTLRPQRAVLDPAGNRWFLADVPDPLYGLPTDWHGIHILSRDKSEWLRVQPETTGMEMRGKNISHVVFRHDLVIIASRDYGVESWYTGGADGGYDWQRLKDFNDNDIWGGEINARLERERELEQAKEVTALALRSDGVLWIGTDWGVYKYSPAGTFRWIRDKTGNEVGLLDSYVNFVALDHYENLWVATNLGLNRIARDDDNDIAAYTTAVGYQTLAGRGAQYPPSVITPLAGELCTDLLLHPNDDRLYIATHGGLSILDIAPPPPQPTDLTKVYLYPNPVDGSRNHNELRIDNIDAPVTVEVYDLEGNLVHSQTATQSEDVVWDLTTRNGFFVASGTYLVRVDNGQSSVILPVAVIR